MSSCALKVVELVAISFLYFFEWLFSINTQMVIVNIPYQDVLRTELTTDDLNSLWH